MSDGFVLPFRRMLLRLFRFTENMLLTRAIQIPWIDVFRGLTFMLALLLIAVTKFNQKIEPMQKYELSHDSDENKNS